MLYFTLNKKIFLVNNYILSFVKGQKALKKAQKRDFINFKKFKIN